MTRTTYTKRNEIETDLLIIRYNNRKLYNTELKQYCTLLDIWGYVHNHGYPVKIVAYDTQHDITRYVFACVDAAKEYEAVKEYL